MLTKRFHWSADGGRRSRRVGRNGGGGGGEAVFATSSLTFLLLYKQHRFHHSTAAASSAMAIAASPSRTSPPLPESLVFFNRILVINEHSGGAEADYFSGNGVIEMVFQREEAEFFFFTLLFLKM